MKITKEIIEIVEKVARDDDLRQDLYEHLIWHKGEVDNLQKFIAVTYKGLALNQHRKEANRRRLEEDNAELIKQNLHGSEQSSPDPLHVLMSENGMRHRIRKLSDMQKRLLHDLVEEGLSAEKIALREKTTCNVIYKRIYDLKQALRK